VKSSLLVSVLLDAEEQLTCFPHQLLPQTSKTCFS
jgi:hypothetical protein